MFPLQMAPPPSIVSMRVQCFTLKHGAGPSHVFFFPSSILV